MRHPIQPLYVDESGVVRFRENRIVRLLLDTGPFTLNSLSRLGFLREDWAQFYQLIGYSLDGLGDVCDSWVGDDTYSRAVALWEQTRKENETPR